MSLALATSLIIAQRDYKRLLAYSSIEHMGLVVIGLAIGTPLAIAASLLHILGHGLGKAVLFCGAGQILVSERHHPDRRSPRAAGPATSVGGQLRRGIRWRSSACHPSACSPANSASPEPPPPRGSDG